MDAEFDASICDLQAAVNGSLIWLHIISFLSLMEYCVSNWEVLHLTDCLTLDHESKKQADCMTTSCSDQLKYLQENHGENVASIRTHAERCLVKNYLVSCLIKMFILLIWDFVASSESYGIWLDK